MHSKIVPFILSQAKSIEDLGHQVDFHTVDKRGFKEYLKSLISLSQKLRKSNYDVIHSHYVYSGWLAVLAKSKEKIVCSFMGTDVCANFREGFLNKLKSEITNFSSKLLCSFVDRIIIKSDNLYSQIPKGSKHKTEIIPNGVDESRFYPLDMDYCRDLLKLSKDKRYIFFPSDTSNPRKNFDLLKRAYENLDSEKYALLTPFPTKQKYLVFYYNASDITVSTSFLEGSQNTLKESLFCNCPIISTKTGDSEEIINRIPGSYSVDYNAIELSEKIKLASSKRPNSRKLLGHLRSDIVAKKIDNIYRVLQT